MTSMKTIQRRSTTLIGALALAGVLAGCGVAAPDATVTPARSTTTTATSLPTFSSAPQATTSAQAPTSAPRSTTDLLASVKVTPDEAAEAALAVVPGGRVTEIDLDRSSGTVVWKVDVATRDAVHEVYVDAAKSKVVANRVDRSASNVSKAQRHLDAAMLTHGDAITAAIRAVPGGQVVDLELDESHGSVVWEVDVITSGPAKRELTINAKTGAVLKHEAEHSDTDTDTDTHTDTHD